MLPCLFSLGICDKENNGPHCSQSPEPMNVLCYMPGGINLTDGVKLANHYADLKIKNLLWPLQMSPILPED